MVVEVEPIPSNIGEAGGAWHTTLSSRCALCERSVQLPPYQLHYSIYYTIWGILTSFIKYLYYYPVIHSNS